MRSAQTKHGCIVLYHNVRTQDTNFGCRGSGKLIIYIYIYIYLGLGSYRLNIKERNGGVRIRWKYRVVDESTPCVANMDCEGFYDGETKLL